MEEQRERLMCIVKHTHLPTVKHLPSPTLGAHVVFDTTGGRNTYTQ